MKTLILTSPPFLEFVFEEAQKYSDRSEFLFKAFGEYDWSEEYDLGISFMYPYRVPKDQLSKTQINFHPGPLPNYKGRNLCYHALLNGETKFGATVHYMDENFDTGDIIEIRRFPILPGWCADNLSEKTFQVSMDLFREYLPLILDGTKFSRNINRGGEYYPKEEIDEFLYLPEDVEDKIRAITYLKFHPRINIGGTIFKVVRE